MTVFLMILCAIGCFVMAFFCGYWALHSVVRAPKEATHYEFAIKQLTAGAWVFALLFIASMVGATIVYTYEPVSIDDILVDSEINE